MPEREWHTEHPCRVPVRPYVADLVQTFNAEPVQQLDALKQTLDATQSLMTEKQQGQAMIQRDALLQT